ncbi:FMN-binding negative transcriptional regulator [Bdellovibrio svalbardensis]|nr:FMN-binding negative transcriptional regulator [Bdellovibrio svalbardensis]
MNDTQLIQELVSDYPLGCLISSSENYLQTNYLPFLLEGGFLISHMAKANPQVEHLDGSFVVVTFQGPERYISPSWYKSAMQVPTWNYAVVEVRGRIEILGQPNEIEEILQKSVTQFEAMNNTAWKYNLPEKFRNELIKHIVGVKIHIEQIEGKFKLSQNRDSQDRESVKTELFQSSHSKDLAMLKLMKTLF